MQLSSMLQGYIQMLQPLLCDHISQHPAHLPAYHWK